MRETKSEKGGSLIRMYNVGEHFKILQKVGRGTYGTVYKVRGLKDNKFYAIKKLENNDVKLQQEGFPITALREITLLKQIDHPNIIKLKEIILSRPSKRNLFRGSTFLVFQYMDHDFAGLFKMRRKFNLPEIKCIFKQLIEGVAYLHKNKILHRDIKSANILLNDQGEVKLADFGLGRKVRLENVFTYKVVTLWYRAPELLWGFKHYSDKIDVWSIGCVAVEFFTGEVLFKKESQHAQIERIYEICGDFEANDLRISEEAAKSYQYLADMRPKKAYKKEIGNYLRKACPGISEITVQFIQSLLNLDPNKRLTCEEALRHPFFNEKPLACTPRDIQKQEYECHEMFKDRSIKIQRAKKDQLDISKAKSSGKQERGYRDYHKRDRQNSMTSQSRQFSSSQSSSNNSSKEYSGSYSEKSKRSNRSKSRSARKRNKSREDRDSRGRRHGYHDRKHHERDNDSRKEKNYHREIREDRKERREEPKEYKLDKERRVDDKDDKYYREKHEKRFKEPRRKQQRYNRFDERIDERSDPKDDRRVPKDDRRDTKHDRRPAKDERRDIKDERRQMKDERRQKDQRRQIKDDRRDKDQRRGKDDQRRGKDDQRRGKDDERRVKDDQRRGKDERREKDDRRQRDERRGQRHHDYKRQSKQKKYDKYQKGKYDSRPYDSKISSKNRPYQDQKDYKRRQQRRIQRQDRDKGREERDNGHQNGKYQPSKQKYSSDYRLGKKPEKFMFVRQKGRKKQASSSSSGSSYSSHHFKKQKQHRSKYSYDRKAYYKKQHSSSGSRGYN